MLKSSFLKCNILLFIFSNHVWPTIAVTHIGPQELLQVLYKWDIDIEKIPKENKDANVKSLETVISILKTYAISKSKGQKRKMSLWQARKEGRDLVDGVMAISPSSVRPGYLEIDALASAPWNLKVEYANPFQSKIRDVGTALMDHALKFASENYEGIYLQPLRSAREFFKNYFSKKEKEHKGDFTRRSDHMIFTYKK